jgi:hypothetical protein
MMSDQNEKTIDVVGRTRAEYQSVAERIERRKVVLAGWLKNGVPAGKHRSLPGSLRTARDWEDPDLGISRIGSPNEFTQNHPLYGKDVREIARLLTELRRRAGTLQHGGAKQRPATTANFDKKEADRQLKKAVSQWHAERHARLSEQKRAEAAEMRAKVVLEENAELRRKLAAYQGPTIVK